MEKDSHLGAPVATADGSLTLTHPELGEEYHSKQGAFFESIELYMERSGFAARLEGETERLSVLDVGLGLGYNALTTIAYWMKAQAPPSLDLLSLEINPELVMVLQSGAASWMKGWSEDWLRWAKSLESRGPDRLGLVIEHPSGTANLRWTIWIGDATEAPFTQVVEVPFHFIWQDAFSPKKNPALWTNAWFEKISASSDPKATLVTYSVARVVKDGLTGAGWSFELIPAPGTKRQWLKAVRHS